MFDQASETPSNGAAPEARRPGRQPGQVVVPPPPMTVSRAVGSIERILRCLADPQDRIAALGVALADAKRLAANAAKPATAAS